MLKKILILLLACLAAAGLYLYQRGILQVALTNFTASLPTNLDGWLTVARNNLAVIVSSITGLVSFVGVAKYISNLKEAKEAVTQQAQSLYSLNTQKDRLLDQNALELSDAKKKLEVYEGQLGGDIVGRVQDLTTKLQMAEHTVEVKQREVDTLNKTITGVEAERNDLQDKIDKLEYDLAVAKGIVKPPIE